MGLLKTLPLFLALNGCTEEEKKAKQNTEEQAKQREIEWALEQRERQQAALKKRSEIAATAMNLLCDVKVDGEYSPEVSLEDGLEEPRNYLELHKGRDVVAGTIQPVADHCMEGKLPRLFADYSLRGAAEDLRYWSEGCGGTAPPVFSTEFQAYNYTGHWLELPDHLQGLLGEAENTTIYLSLSGDTYEDRLLFMKPIDNRWIAKGFLETAGYLNDKLKEIYPDECPEVWIHLEVIEYRFSDSTFSSQVWPFATRIGFDYEPANGC